MISISIISPLKSMAVIDKAIEHNDFGCVFHRYVYENLEEIKDIYEQCKDISDVLFFSGELGYSYILTHVDDLKVPCTFISYTEKTLLSILLNFVIHYPDVPLNRLYIDFLTPVNDFMNLKKYLEPEHMPYCFENPVYNYETLKERAVELWENKKIDMMFTRTTNQLEVLNKLQIPYIHFLPTEEMVRDSIRHAINSIRLKQKNQLNKLVILISSSIRTISPHRTGNIWRSHSTSTFSISGKSFPMISHFTQSPTVSSWTSTVISTRAASAVSRISSLFWIRKVIWNSASAPDLGNHSVRVIIRQTLPCRKLSNTERMTVLSSPARTMPSPARSLLRDP